MTEAYDISHGYDLCLIMIQTPGFNTIQIYRVCVYIFIYLFIYISCALCKKSNIYRKLYMHAIICIIVIVSFYIYTCSSVYTYSICKYCTYICHGMIIYYIFVFIYK